MHHYLEFIKDISISRSEVLRRDTVIRIITLRKRLRAEVLLIRNIKSNENFLKMYLNLKL